MVSVVMRDDDPFQFFGDYVVYRAKQMEIGDHERASVGLFPGTSVDEPVFVLLSSSITLAWL